LPGIFMSSAPLTFLIAPRGLRAVIYYPVEHGSTGQHIAYGAPELARPVGPGQVNKGLGLLTRG